MKNRYFSLFLLIFICSSSSLQLQAQEYQEFAPIGAKWWYENDIIETYVESIRDTILANQNSKILKIERQIKETSNIQTWEVIIYQDANTVYYYLQDEFKILFEFGFADYEVCHPEFSPTIYVWKEESINVNGRELTRFFGIFSTIFYSFNFTLVERIGGNLFLSCIDPNLENIGALKCYEDNEIGKFCDENLWTHLEESSPSFSVNVYPNPSTKGFEVDVQDLHFTNIDNSYIEVVNKMGTTVNSISLKPNTQKYFLQNEDLRSGIYFLNLVIDGILVSREKVLIL